MYRSFRRGNAIVFAIGMVDGWSYSNCRRTYRTCRKYRGHTYFAIEKTEQVRTIRKFVMGLGGNICNGFKTSNVFAAFSTEFWCFWPSLTTSSFFARFWRPSGKTSDHYTTWRTFTLLRTFCTNCKPWPLYLRFSRPSFWHWKDVLPLLSPLNIIMLFKVRWYMSNQKFFFSSRNMQMKVWNCHIDNFFC